MTPTPRRVTSSDGVTLAVYAGGAAGRPTVLAVHGYPDNHAVWDGVAELLADEFHVATYDVRGAGESDKPATRSAYRMPQLVADLAAVADAVSPDQPVHLLGHDWGSVQSWPALTDRRLAGRIATFTSISGPSLDQAAVWLRRLHRHPRAALRQLAHSYYVALFQLPRLPEAVVRSSMLDRAIDRGSPRTEADKVNGLSLYRANVLRGLTAARPARVTLPVQVIAPESDAFVIPEFAIEAPRPWVADLTVRRILAGHWVVSEQPEVIARLAREFIRPRRLAARR